MDDVNNLLGDLDIDIPEVPGLDGDGATGDVVVHDAHFFGPYQIIREIGVGGVARVLRARHIHPRFADQRFAVKVLHAELSRDPRVVSLFRHEAYVLALLKHPNIVQTFEAGEQENELFIAMEYINGRDLDNMLLRCQRAHILMPIPVALHIAGEVLKAIAYAHDLCGPDGTRLNLLHRDVNPANVFLSYDGRVKLGDFGVADITAGRLEKSREVTGKVGYFAPEQLTGAPVDQRADLFAMGVMVFEMLCGVRLFCSEDTDEAMRMNRRAKVPKLSKLNPQLPAALERVVLGALERKPDNRYATAREMLAALEPLLPDPSSMALAVAAMMRKMFLREHIQELHLDEGLAGNGPARGSGQVVDVISADPRARQAFNELLLSRGYRVRLHEQAPSLGSALAQERPAVILADVSSGQFADQDFRAALQCVDGSIPVVAVSEGLGLDWVRLADGIGAVDILLKPFNIERVLTALRAAITGAARVAKPSDVGLGGREVVLVSKVLLLCREPQLIASLSLGLAERGFEIDVSTAAGDALNRVDYTSYHAVVYDAHPAASADRLFAGQYRARPGMGLVPLIYLVDEDSRPVFRGMLTDRCAVEARTSSASFIGDVILRLRSDANSGRCFIRYRTSFDVELRYGGRVFIGKAVDLSRGGLMLQCVQLPPVATQVGISLRLPGTPTPVQATGCIVRVDLLNDGLEETGARLGIAFQSFAGRSESDLIRFIANIDQRAKLPQPVGFGKPPGGGR